MNKNLIIVVVLLALVVMGTIQAVQLNSLKDKLETSGTPKISGASVKTPKASPGGGGSSLPSNLQNLPAMVGGC